MDNDTIFALSSGALPSGVAIIRLSGPQSAPVLRALCGSVPENRRARLCTLKDPESRIDLDEALVLFFEGPNSFTGEDVVELHCHGGRATVAAVLECLTHRDGCRLAEAGEFSRRAFLNGRLDLTELEGLADLVSAETEQQRRLALDQSGGSLRTLYDGWRMELVQLRAFIEADFDFSDEHDISDSVTDAVWPRLRDLIGHIERHLSGQRQGEILRDGFRVVLTGPPNAGKSTVFNGLLKREAAIVTDIPGTTRDVLEARLDIDGYLVRVFDTAGIRETSDTIEQMGIDRAQAAVANADLVLQLDPAGIVDSRETTRQEPTTVRVRTHSSHNRSQGTVYEIDARTDTGINLVSDIIAAQLATIRMDNQALPNRLRYIEGLKQCVELLHDGLSEAYLLEIRAEKLREACDELGRLTGRVDVEDLLDVIFSQFCLGK